MGKKVLGLKVGPSTDTGTLLIVSELPNKKLVKFIISISGAFQNVYRDKSTWYM